MLHKIMATAPHSIHTSMIIASYQIYQRQLSKMGLSKSVVDGDPKGGGGAGDGGGGGKSGASESRQFCAEELRSLFKVCGGITCSLITQLIPTAASFRWT